MKSQKNFRFNRRRFFNSAFAGGMGVLLTSFVGKRAFGQQEEEEIVKPSTNIDEAVAIPRTKSSLPGKYPGKVIISKHKNCLVDNEPVDAAAFAMLEKSILGLTGAKTLKDAWLEFVNPDDVIGLKLNPVAGPLLSNTHSVVKAVIKQLVDIGVPEKNIVLFDRREFQLHEAGFTTEAFPGVKITGTEIKDAEGSFYDADGVLYGEKMIDKEWYYWADVEGEYDAYTLPYMVNGGKYSYFSKICTQEVDKIINMPVLKNAGSSVTLCLKNLAYGVVSNTGRLHKDLWSDTCAEVCAFPPVRDKVVLNIVDGLKGCFNGGPAANPQFITDFKCLLVGSDPVAVDRIGYDIIIKKRIEEGLQEEDNDRYKEFMYMAQDLKLGIADRENITLNSIELT